MPAWSWANVDVWKIGTTTAPVRGSGSCPAWMARVLKPSTSELLTREMYSGARPQRGRTGARAARQARHVGTRRRGLSGAVDPPSGRRQHRCHEHHHAAPEQGPVLEVQVGGVRLPGELVVVISELGDGGGGYRDQRTEDHRPPAAPGEHHQGAEHHEHRGDGPARGGYQDVRGDVLEVTATVDAFDDGADRVVTEGPEHPARDRRGADGQAGPERGDHVVLLSGLVRRREVGHRLPPAFPRIGTPCHPWCHVARPDDGGTRVAGQVARKCSRSARVSTPAGLPSSTTITASEFSRACRAAVISSPEPTNGNGAAMCVNTASASVARPANRSSSSARSDTAPTTSPAITGGSALTTGICDTPYSRMISTASRMVSLGWVCTRSGSRPLLPRSTSPTLPRPASARKP